MQLVLIIEVSRNFDWTTPTIGVGVLIKQVDIGLNFFSGPYLTVTIWEILTSISVANANSRPARCVTK